MRKLVDGNDIQIKQFKPLHTRLNHRFCLLDAGCVENREEALIRRGIARRDGSDPRWKDLVCV
jgi:hypothetical protein